MRLSLLIATGLAVIGGICGVTTLRVLHSDYSIYENGSVGMRAGDLARKIMVASTLTSLERGPTNAALGASSPSDAQKATLEKARSSTDEAFRAAEQGAGLLTGEQLPAMLSPLRQAQDRLKVARRSADVLATKPLKDRSSAELSDTVSMFIDALAPLDLGLNAVELKIAQSDPEVIARISIARSATELRDYAGQIGSVFTAALAANRPLEPLELSRYDRLTGRTDALVQQIGLAHAKLGDDPQIDKAFGLIEGHYLTEGRRIVGTVADQSRANHAAAMSPADLAASYVPQMVTIVTFRDGVLNSALDVLATRSAAGLHALYVDVVIAVLILVTIAAIIWFFQTRVVRPVGRLTRCMEALANGDHAVVVPAADRGDEVGEMAVAVEVFKRAAIRNAALEADVELNRRNTEAEREALRDRAEREAEARLQAATSSLAGGLRALAAGDMCCEIADPFAPQFEPLRHDFNSSVVQLRDVLKAVDRATAAVGNGSREISQASQDLSRRTEQQAASLEETAAALDEITATVRRTAEGARQAHDLVGHTRSDTQSSSEVVGRATEAMGGIERSSAQITRIIGVIDEIAFQTNLLALNAGVEAARAGDAGRGFAVVASEVRALAQRSAEAAKEIKGLILASSSEVSNGVALVGETGQALRRIAARVVEIDGIVATIAASAQEQASGLEEVNTAVNQMDQVTQQNAAMVEQSTAAAHGLRRETEELAHLVEQFRLAAEEPTPSAPPPLKASGPLVRATEIAAAAVSRVRGGAATKLRAVPATDGWEEF